MWIVTPFGFLAACEHRDDPATIIVRARVRRDLEQALEQIPMTTDIIWLDKTADYPYRCEMSRAVWRRLLLAVGEPDYPTLKQAVGERQGTRRYRILTRVWDALVGLEEEDPDVKDRGGPWGGRQSVQAAAAWAAEESGTCEDCGGPVVGPWQTCEACAFDRPLGPLEAS